LSPLILRHLPTWYGSCAISWIKLISGWHQNMYGDNCHLFLALINNTLSTTELNGRVITNWEERRRKRAWPI
jgi:hypothetical protein